MLDRAAHAVTRRRAEGEAVGLMLIDIDRFRTVNTGLGPSAADVLLREIAMRLDALVRQGDSVARMGDDEFGILIDGALGGAGLLASARRLEAALSEPFEIGGKELTVSVSIGVAGAVAGARPDDLLRDAEVALAACKAPGRGGPVLFRPEMHTAAVERLDLERELRAAVDSSQFVLEYQPLVVLGDRRRPDQRRVALVEALVRWRHPLRGLVPPDTFIPAAEETGLIMPIGRWVLREACRQAHAWQRSSADHRALSISVNLSPRQLGHPSLLDDLQAALDDSGLGAGSLVVEITESAIIHDVAGAIATLHAIRALGVRVALDDFGTGYSSLKFLTTLPIDVVKIDRGFVAGLGRGTRDAAVVRPIIELAKVLGLETVGEGIETRAQADALTDFGCDLAQGFYFSRPLGAEGLSALLSGDGRGSRRR